MKKLLISLAACCYLATTVPASGSWLFPTKAEKLQEEADALARATAHAQMRADREAEWEAFQVKFLVDLFKGAGITLKHTICLPVTIIRALDDSSDVGLSDVLKGLAAAGVTASVIMLIKEWTRLFGSTTTTRNCCIC